MFYTDIFPLKNILGSTHSLVKVYKVYTIAPYGFNGEDFFLPWSWRENYTIDFTWNLSIWTEPSFP